MRVGLTSIEHTSHLRKVSDKSMTQDNDNDNADEAFDEGNPSGDWLPESDESEFEADSLIFDLDDCTDCYTGNREIPAYLRQDGQNDSNDELRFRTRRGYLDLAAGVYYSNVPLGASAIYFNDAARDEDPNVDVDPDFE